MITYRVKTFVKDISLHVHKTRISGKGHNNNRKKNGGDDGDEEDGIIIII
jgi:hypothetical protein